MILTIFRMSGKLCLSPIFLAFTIVVSIFLMAPTVNEIKAARWNYSAPLAGKNEVPAVPTTAIGLADFRISDNDTGIRYRVNLTGISNVTGGHIDIGKTGQNGDIVADMFQIGFSKHKKTAYGMIVRGNITGQTLKGPMKGKTISDLISLIDAGNAYVNINSRNHPQGEVRGQIDPSNQTKSNISVSAFQH